MQDSTYDWTKLGEQVKYIKGSAGLLGTDATVNPNIGLYHTPFAESGKTLIVPTQDSTEFRVGHLVNDIFVSGKTKDDKEAAFKAIKKVLETLDPSMTLDPNISYQNTGALKEYIIAAIGEQSHPNGFLAFMENIRALVDLPDDNPLRKHQSPKAAQTKVQEAIILLKKDPDANREAARDAFLEAAIAMKKEAEMLFLRQQLP